MNEVYFDRSSVRGISENLHYRTQGYESRINEIAELFGGAGGDSDGPDSRSKDSNGVPIGSAGPHYYGRELGETLKDNTELRIAWLKDGLLRSLGDMSDALAVADEDYTGGDHDNADEVAAQFRPSDTSNASHNEPDPGMM
ncbi:MAG: hypothetical protein ACRDXX_03445 [Stackebrandtia sp.]